MSAQSNATSAVPSRHYFKAIDGLRLFAAVNIVLFHAEQSGGFYAMEGRPWWFFLLIKGPMFHASLFFILGGFIYTIKHAAKAEMFDTRVFFMRRLRALYPLHVVTTLAMVPFAVWGAAEISSGTVAKIVGSVFVHISMLWAFFPFHTYQLNTPSWALSAFFLCYAVFGLVLRRIVRLERRREVMGAIALCCVVLALWATLYAVVHARIGFQRDVYLFFHVFAPVRLVEFVVGMLLARLYQVSTYKTRGRSVWARGLMNDVIIVGTLALLFGNLLMRSRGGPVLKYYSYHVVAVPLFALLVYRFARGSGLLPGFTSIPLVRKLGQCSFYPYLLHIPCMAWLSWLMHHGFGYNTFLHWPVNIWLFVAVLYGLSAVYFDRIGRARRARGAQAVAVAETHSGTAGSAS